MAMKSPITDPNVKTRRGSIVMLIALTLPLIIALVAFAVDYGIIVVAKQELQNASDAAATATLETLIAHPTSADDAAHTTITANRLLGSPITFDIAQDVHYGTWDEDTKSFEEIPRDGAVKGASDVSGRSVPDGANAVRIRLTRSVARGNAIQLFFAPVIGTDFAEVEAEAIAFSAPPCSGFRVSVAPGSTVSGQRGTRVSDQEFDPVDFNQANVNDNDRIPKPPKFSFPKTFLSSEGDLVVANGRNIHLASGVYRVRDLRVAGGSRLTIDGDVTIFVEREVSLDNGTCHDQQQC